MTAASTDTPENSGESADDASPADWGLETKTGGLSRETKIGLALIAILLCAFTFVVYKRINEARNPQPSEEGQQVASESADDAPPAASDKPTLRPTAGTEAPPVATNDPPAFDRQPHSATPQPAPSDDPFAALALDETPPPASPVEETVPLAAEPAISEAHPLLAAQQMERGVQETEPPPAIPDGDPFAFDAPPVQSSEPPQQSEPAAAGVQLVADQSEPPARRDQPAEVFDLFPPDPAPAAPATPATVATPTPTQEAKPAAELLDPFAPIEPLDGAMEPGDPAEPTDEQSEPAQPQELPDDVAGEPLTPAAARNETDASRSPLDAPLFDDATSDNAAPPGNAGRAEAASTTVVLPPGETAAEPGHHSHPVELAFEEPLTEPSPPRSTGQPAQPADDLFAQPTPAAHEGNQPLADSPGNYTVRPGDSFWLISRRHYGTARYYMALARYNSDRIADPALMRPGIKIKIPDRETLEAACPDLFPSRSATPASTAATGHDQPAGFTLDAAGRPIYRTSAEDTLSTIAERHLGRSSRWIQIYEMNRSVLASPDDLKVGTTLRLPADATPGSQTRQAD